MTRLGTNARGRDRCRAARFLLAFAILGSIVSCATPVALMQPDQSVGPDLGPPAKPLNAAAESLLITTTAKRSEDSLPPPAIVLPNQTAASDAAATSSPKLPPAAKQTGAVSQPVAVAKPDPGSLPTVAAKTAAADSSPEIVQTTAIQEGQTLAPPKAAAPAVSVTLAAPVLDPTDRPLPITLAAAMQLTNVRAWDVDIASVRIRSAAADLERAAVIWVPSLYNGLDYVHHEGPVQNTDGSLTDTTRSSMEVGMAPYAVFQINDAIFEPLAVRQLRDARQADLQSTTNDTLFAVAQAYFDVEEARANMAGMGDVLKRMRELLSRVQNMTPGLVPAVEVSRTQAQIGRLEQTERAMRERWRVAGAELVRILRMDPAAIVEPLEPPHLVVTLVSPKANVDDLIDMGLRARPELASYRAQVEAALLRWREERLRPFVPIVLLRGDGTQTPYPMAFGAYGAGQGSSLNNFSMRSDWDLQVLWELRNMGLGNIALIRQRQAERDAIDRQFYRMRDLVSREIVQAYAQLQSAEERRCQAEWALREALASANENFAGLGETKRVGGNINILVIRPQEAIAAVQELSQAYFNYFGATADYNRAQFRLYRAMGNPGHLLDAPPPAQPAECPTK